MLIIDVRKVNDDHILATAMVAWETIKPEIVSIYTSETLHKFFQQLQAPWLPDKQSVGNFPSGFTVPPHNSNLIFALQNGVFTKEQIQYELYRNGKIHTAWRNNDYDNSFIWLKDCPPGNYIIKIRYSVQPQNITEHSFQVKPVWYETVLFRILVCLLLLTLVGLLVLSVRQRRKLHQEKLGKSRLQLELRAIYSQLNPHFVFNALSSIQALINKQDIRGANTYLSDFAQLTRDSLVHSQKSKISLHEEIQTLDTYLKLEKLRFGFDYQISIAPELNEYEIDIPTLLMQPLIENAVKHGVALLGEKGSVKLSLNPSGPAIIARLTDNGKGIGADQSVTGLGLKLTKDRINLLNQIDPKRQITLNIANVHPTGTQVTLTFNQWLDESFNN